VPTIEARTLRTTVSEALSTGRTAGLTERHDQSFTPGHLRTTQGRTLTVRAETERDALAAVAG